MNLTSTLYSIYLSKNLPRLNQNIIAKTVAELTRNGKFHPGAKLSYIIENLNLQNVSPDIQVELCEALKESLPLIIEWNGNPQLIVGLVRQNPNIFSSLAAIPNNGLVGIDMLLYEVNMGKGDWYSVLNTEIDTAIHQFQTNNRANAYSSFAENPYHLITVAVTKHFDSKIEEICLEKLFPLCIEILKSLAPMPTKEQCITALCDILAYYKANKIVIPEKLVDAISHFDPASTPNLHFVERVSTGTLSCKTLLLKLIVGLLGKEELIKWCISYSKKEVNERVALSNCIETFLRYAEDINDQSDVIILAIVLQCFEDEDASIRRAACTCLSYLLKTQHRVLVKNKLYEATLDASHTVRLRLLQLCNSGAITDSDVVDHIMNILSRDAYYIIRQELKASI